MGEEAGFDRDELPEADPQFVAKLARLQPPLSNPELLARLIARRIEPYDISMRLVGIERGIAGVRDLMKRELAALQISARSIEAEVDRKRDIDPWMIAADYLIDHKIKGPARRKLVARLIDAVGVLASLPISKTGMPPGRPAADKGASDVIRAVADYCDQAEDFEFAGEPRSTVKGGWKFSRAAELALAALKLVDPHATPSQVRTYMRTLIKERAVRKPA